MTPNKLENLMKYVTLCLFVLVLALTALQFRPTPNPVELSKITSKITHEVEWVNYVDNYKRKEELDRQQYEAEMQELAECQNKNQKHLNRC